MTVTDLSVTEQERLKEPIGFSPSASLAELSASPAVNSLVGRTQSWGMEESPQVMLGAELLPSPLPLLGAEEHKGVSECSCCCLQYH